MSVKTVKKPVYQANENMSVRPSLVTAEAQEIKWIITRRDLKGSWIKRLFSVY